MSGSGISWAICKSALKQCNSVEFSFEDKTVLSGNLGVFCARCLLSPLC